MSVVRWEPFGELLSLREAVDRFWEGGVVRGGTLTVPLELYQTEDDIVVRTPMPGVRPEDIDVNVLAETLTIKGEIKEERPEKAGYFLRELRYGQFSRSITLPFAVSADRAQASFEHGVLTLRLPKAESAKPRTIKIGTNEKK